MSIFCILEIIFASFFILFNNRWSGVSENNVDVDYVSVTFIDATLSCVYALQKRGVVKRGQGRSFSAFRIGNSLPKESQWAFHHKASITTLDTYAFIANLFFVFCYLTLKHDFLELQHFLVGVNGQNAAGLRLGDRSDYASSLRKHL